MRAALAALAVAAAASASAQPTAPRVALAYRLPAEVAVAGAVASNGSPDVSPAYRTAVTTVVAGTGATLGATLPLMFVVLSSSGLGATDQRSVSDGVLVAVAGVGSVVGAGLAVYAIGEDEASYDGILPYADIRREDWPAALAGAAAGLLPGIAVALLIQQALPSDADPFLSYLAVPVVQGLGASVAISLSR